MEGSTNWRRWLDLPWRKFWSRNCWEFVREKHPPNKSQPWVFRVNEGELFHRRLSLKSFFWNRAEKLLNSSKKVVFSPLSITLTNWLIQWDFIPREISRLCFFLLVILQTSSTSLHFPFFSPFLISSVVVFLFHCFFSPPEIARFTPPGWHHGPFLLRSLPVRLPNFRISSIQQFPKQWTDLSYVINRSLSPLSHYTSFQVR